MRPPNHMLAARQPGVAIEARYTRGSECLLACLLQTLADTRWIFFCLFGRTVGGHNLASRVPQGLVSQKGTLKGIYSAMAHFWGPV